MACVGKCSASTTGNNAIMGSLLAVDGLDDVLLHVSVVRGVLLMVLNTSVNS